MVTRIAPSLARERRFSSHCLAENPAWLADGDFSPAELRSILHEHIFTVVGRYSGRIRQWDVANEIFDDSGTCAPRRTSGSASSAPASRARTPKATPTTP